MSLIKSVPINWKCMYWTYKVSSTRCKYLRNKTQAFEPLAFQGWCCTWEEWYFNKHRRGILPGKVLSYIIHFWKEILSCSYVNTYNCEAMNVVPTGQCLTSFTRPQSQWKKKHNQSMKKWFHYQRWDSFLRLSKTQRHRVCSYTFMFMNNSNPSPISTTTRHVWKMCTYCFIVMFSLPLLISYFWRLMVLMVYTIDFV